MPTVGKHDKEHVPKPRYLPFGGEAAKEVEQRLRSASVLLGTRANVR